MKLTCSPLLTFAQLTVSSAAADLPLRFFLDGSEFVSRRGGGTTRRANPEPLITSRTRIVMAGAPFAWRSFGTRTSEQERAGGKAEEARSDRE